jgi:hypothetical protein
MPDLAPGEVLEDYYDPAHEGDTAAAPLAVEADPNDLPDWF